MACGTKITHGREHVLELEWPEITVLGVGEAIGGPRRTGVRRGVHRPALRPDQLNDQELRVVPVTPVPDSSLLETKRSAWAIAATGLEVRRRAP